MMKWLAKQITKISNLAVWIVVLTFLLLGLQQGGMRRQKLAWRKNLKQNAKQKIIEVQDAQLKASYSVRGGRDELSKRMRSGRF